MTYHKIVDLELEGNLETNMYNSLISQKKKLSPRVGLNDLSKVIQAVSKVEFEARSPDSRGRALSTEITCFCLNIHSV